jgi:chemotaxis protein methyltransferase CheR
MVLRTAQHLEYEKDTLRQIPLQYRQGIESVGTDRWRLSSAVARRIRFVRHHLLLDPYPQGFHGILCRNVLIYFEPRARRTVVEQFVEALLPQGCLWLGATETLLEWRELGLRVVGPSLFQKTGDGSKSHVPR